jgi:hypothetical protein
VKLRKEKNSLHLLCDHTTRQRNGQCMLTTTSRCKDSGRSRSIDLIISTLMLRLLKVLLSLLHRQFNQYSIAATNAAKDCAGVNTPCSDILTLVHKEWLKENLVLHLKFGCPIHRLKKCLNHTGHWAKAFWASARTLAINDIPVSNTTCTPQP